MKTLFSKTIFGSFLFLFTLAGCKDYNDLDVEPVPTGDADFSTYVSVGNSLTAGYRNAALFESGQEFSFPNLLARQFRKAEEFSQPLISDPGIGGRLELTQLEPPLVTPTEGQGQPINQDQKPFSNLGIPGAVLVDYTNPNNSGNLKERATNPNHPAFNPFYGIVLEQSELAKPAPNIHHEVAKQSPTFITFWLGNNDVLGFVISGGEGQSITPPSTFVQLYALSGQKLAETGADVVVYTIPNVTTIPYVFLLRGQLEQQQVIVFNETTQNYQLVTQQGNFNIFINVEGTPQLLRKDDFLLLSARAYFGQVAAGQAPPPITPQNAIPDNLVLDGNLATPTVDSELEQTVAAVTQYNAAIQNVASTFGFAVVDINGIFAGIFQNFVESGGGYDAGELTLQPVPGSLISLDGIHPTNRGYAVIANETIKVINDFYGANVELIDIKDIPRGLAVVSEKKISGS